MAPSDSSRRVVIVHPFVQAYRRGLYTRLAERLADDGFELVVVSSAPAPRLAGRSDAIEASWTTRVPSRWWTLGEHDLGYRRLGGLRLGRGDLVIVEQAVKNLETYPALLRMHLGGARVAMWGHGRSYSTPQGSSLAAMKQWLTRRTEWFFAYTEAGAQHVLDHGFPAGRVTVLNNTVDTDELQADLAGAGDVAAFMATQRLTAGRTALFIGGVDKAKGIDFLLAGALQAADDLPGFTLLIAGAGTDADKVERLERAGGPVRALGRLEGHDRALALRACDALAIPEWIGLVAVDSLVAGRPIVSTEHHSHSPEREYLRDGVTAVFAAHDPVAYGHALAGLLGDPERLARMQAACLAEAGGHALSRTVDAFIDGIRAWDASR